MEEVLRFGELAPTLGSSTAPASTTSIVPPVAIELGVVHDAVDDQVTLSPTTCSTECPSKNAHASVSVTISSTASNSSTTICGVVPELAAPTVSDKAVDMVVPGDADRKSVV